MHEILILTKADIPEIAAFNEATWAAGHDKALYRHAAAELEYSFDQESLIAVGCRSEDGKLQALSLTKRGMPRDFDFLMMNDPLKAMTDDEIFLGLNTIISPEARSPRLFRRLIEARSQICVQAGGKHVLAGISQDNTLSLGCSLALGARIVGMHRCQGVLEFTMLGTFGSALTPVKTKAQPVSRTNTAGILELVDQGFLGIGLERRADALLFAHEA